ncbi:MAG TPA: hypothetical protein VGD74_06110 [Vulgatibacter sp.]
MSQIDTLRALLAAPPSLRTEYVALPKAAADALPALLAVAEAAGEWRDAHREFGESETGTLARVGAANAALLAALAALESP